MEALSIKYVNRNSDTRNNYLLVEGDILNVAVAGWSRLGECCRRSCDVGSSKISAIIYTAERSSGLDLA